MLSLESAVEPTTSAQISAGAETVVSEVAVVEAVVVPEAGTTVEIAASGAAAAIEIVSAIAAIHDVHHSSEIVAHVEVIVELVAVVEAAVAAAVRTAREVIVAEASVEAGVLAAIVGVRRLNATHGLAGSLYAPLLVLRQIGGVRGGVRCCCRDFDIGLDEAVVTLLDDALWRRVELTVIGGLVVGLVFFGGDDSGLLHFGLVLVVAHQNVVAYNRSDGVALPYQLGGRCDIEVLEYLLGLGGLLVNHRVGLGLRARDAFEGLVCWMR